MFLHKAIVFFFGMGIVSAASLFAAEKVQIRQHDFYKEDGIAYISANNQVLTGDVFYVYGSGNTESRRPYVDGLLHGVATFWYENGRAKQELTYVKGEMQGVTRGWHENGMPAFEGEYKKGKQHGTWIQWDEAGAVVSERTYNADAKSKLVLAPPRPPSP